MQRGSLVNKIRRLCLSIIVVSASLLAGCGALMPAMDAEVRQALAPTGKLRVGVYPGSPTSMIQDPKTGQKVGVTLDLGRELARQLGVPFEPVEYRRVAEVVDAMKTGDVDFTFTNASAARAQVVDFTAPLIALELGYLVPPTSTLFSPADIDRAGIKVGVSQGSTSEGVLTREFRNATVVPAASLKAAAEMLTQGKLDAFATNKAILFEMSDTLPAFRVLDGRWGLENLAIAIPQGRERGMPYLRQFAAQVKAGGLLQSIVEKAGLRGTVQVVSP